jgi:hypothetical protein
VGLDRTCLPRDCERAVAVLAGAPSDRSLLGNGEGQGDGTTAGRQRGRVSYPPRFAGRVSSAATCSSKRETRAAGRPARSCVASVAGGMLHYASSSPSRPSQARRRPRSGRLLWAKARAERICARPSLPQARASRCMCRCTMTRPANLAHRGVSLRVTKRSSWRAESVRCWLSSKGAAGVSSSPASTGSSFGDKGEEPADARADARIWANASARSLPKSARAATKARVRWAPTWREKREPRMPSEHVLAARPDSRECASAGAGRDVLVYRRGRAGAA